MLQAPLVPNPHVSVIIVCTQFSGDQDILCVGSLATYTHCWVVCLSERDQPWLCSGCVCQACTQGAVHMHALPLLTPIKSTAIRLNSYRCAQDTQLLFMCDHARHRRLQGLCPDKPTKCLQQDTLPSSTSVLALKRCCHFV